jgi:hypothetical protein
MSSLHDEIINYAFHYRSKVLAERRVILLRIQEVSGSNLDPETGCPEVVGCFRKG